MKRYVANLALIIVLGLSTAQAWAQMVNKCPGPDGKPVYQQMPCSPQGGGEKLNIPTPKMDASQRISIKLSGDIKSVRQATPEEIQACLSFLKIVYKYKDPDSIKLEGNANISLYSNGNYVLILNVNAKNSYGAYAGAELHMCIFNEKGVVDEVI